MQYTIQSISPSNEEGYVYADVLINDETEPRRLILPENTEEAQATMEAYLQEEATPEPVVEAPVAELIDQTIEV